MAIYQTKRVATDKGGRKSLNVAAIAQHLTIAETAIVEIQEWAKVLWVRFKGGCRFVSKKIGAVVKKMETGLPKRRYNPANQAIRDKLTAAQNNGLIVVCTSRPLPGLESWQGEWCGGVWWAIGNEDFIDQWEALDAKEIELVSNEQLILEAKARIADYKVKHPTFKQTWETILERNGGDLKRTVRAILIDCCWCD